MKYTKLEIRRATSHTGRKVYKIYYEATKPDGMQGGSMGDVYEVGSCLVLIHPFTNEPTSVFASMEDFIGQFAAKCGINPTML